MSSISLVYSNRKVCARWDGLNRRFRLFSNVDVKHVKGPFSMIFKCRA